jgi:hypothetical protein
MEKQTERLKKLIEKKKTSLHLIALKKKLNNEDLVFLVEQLGEEGAVKFLIEEHFYFNYKKNEIRRASRVKL